MTYETIAYFGGVLIVSCMWLQTIREHRERLARLESHMDSRVRNWDEYSRVLWSVLRRHGLSEEAANAISHVCSNEHRLPNMTTELYVRKDFEGQFAENGVVR